MKRLLLVCGLVASVLCAGSLLRADDAVLLRYKMKKDDKLLYRTTTNLIQNQSFAGNEIKTTIKTTDIAERTLDKIDEKGNFEIRTENKRLQMEMSVGPLGKYTFDSTSEERDKGGVIGSALNPLLERKSGAVLTVVHTPLGELTAVRGYKELLADLLKDNPIIAQFAPGSSDESAKLEMAELFAEFSEKPVKPGDTWETVFEVNLPKLGKGKGKKTYRYEGMDNVGETKTAKISVNYELSFDLELEQGGAKITGTLATDDSSGTIHFDPIKGQLVSAKRSYSISGDLSVNANGQDLTIGTEQAQTVKTERLDKLPE